jgi:hypothetical protein
LDYQGQASELNQHAARIEVFFKAHPPQTITEAQAKIHELTSIQRSPTQVKALGASQLCSEQKYSGVSLSRVL